MVSEKATLVNPQGLHMRPAGLFASTMGKYACDVTVVTPREGGSTASPRWPSWLLVSPAVPRSRSSAHGADEAEALAAAIELIKSGLGE